VAPAEASARDMMGIPVVLFAHELAQMQELAREQPAAVHLQRVLRVEPEPPVDSQSAYTDDVQREQAEDEARIFDPSLPLMFVPLLRKVKKFRLQYFDLVLLEQATLLLDLDHSSKSPLKPINHKKYHKKLQKID
jgi:hypothetical protein